MRKPKRIEHPFRIEDVKYAKEIERALEEVEAFFVRNRGKEVSDRQVIEALYPLKKYTPEAIGEYYVRGAATARALEILSEQGTLERRIEGMNLYFTLH